MKNPFILNPYMHLLHLIDLVRFFVLLIDTWVSSMRIYRKYSSQKMGFMLTYDETILDIDSEKCLEAMKSEIDSIHSN